MIPANPPWSTRAATSSSPDCDSAAPREAAVNPTIPITKMRLCPKTSPSRPPVMSSVAKAMM